MKISIRSIFLSVFTLAVSAANAAAQTNWRPAKGPLMTRWAKEVSPSNALPEYPRPQMVRKNWLNLNGLWQYQSGQSGDLVPVGQKLSGQIMVPFAVESALSGVMEHHDWLWYRRSFNLPANWKNQRVLLHFGAVDYEADVTVNGQHVGIHRGGYDEFSFDITPYLKASGAQEIIVRVFDPTDAGGQPRGKQTLKPGGIMYTPVSGIWQTVWLEPVAPTSIQNLNIVTDIDKNQVKITVNARGTAPATRVGIAIRDGKKFIQTATGKPGEEIVLPVKNAKLWSPDSPFLYDLDVAVRNDGKESDRISSYFGMRKIALGKINGITRMMLNNKFVFHIGPLDQGYWPDGLYTAPTDEALRFDLEMTKKMGFNMVRKHLKVEPARWYYHADRLGLMVWQDMPSPNSYAQNPPPLDKIAFENQIDEVINEHRNSPAIVMWVLVNEGQGDYDQARLVARMKQLDATRLVNRHSGAGNHSPRDAGEVGDIDDVHVYPAPGAPNPSPNQALVCGEYGGIGYVLKGHTWSQENWGYTTINSGPELEDRYGEYLGILQKLRDEKGLSGAVYTQITDVEVETNGLMTYDRLLKADVNEIRRANHFQYPQPTYVEISPVSDPIPQQWRYTIDTPPANWTQANFDAAGWKTGPGAFGGKMEGGPRISTSWESNDIWLRRSFEVGNLTPAQIDQFVLRQLHDDDIEVFINGVEAYKSGSAVHDYEDRTIAEAARRAIVPNATNVLAVHCHENFGDQHVDAGIYRRVPAQK